MKLYIEKEACKITESINGRVLEIETFDPILIEEYSARKMLYSSSDPEFGTMDEPFLTNAPKDFKL